MKFLSYWRLRYERDPDDGRIYWDTVEWRDWIRGFLPGHWINYLKAKDMERIIARHDQFGDYWVVPEGYTFQVMHKKAAQDGLSDPLDSIETVGIKFTHHSRIRIATSDMGKGHAPGDTQQT